MRFVLLILALMISAVPPALAQGNGAGNGNANGQENGNSQGNGSENGRGNGNGNGGANGNGSASANANANGNGQGQGNNSLPGSAGGPAASPSSQAPNPGGANGTISHSQDYARDAVNAGKAVSLGSLLPDLEKRVGGDVIDAELLSIRGTLVYSVRVLRATGRVTREYYDAQTGRFIGSQ